MTLPPVVRVFFAIGLPDPFKEQIKHLIGDIKKTTKNHAIRFTLPENLHVTLQFVGEVPQTSLSLLITKVKEQIDQEILSHEFEFSKLSVLPSPYRPRVVVLDIKAEEKITHLSASIGKGMEASGFEVEKRPFRGHLTLGRIKQPKALDLGFLRQVALPALPPVKVQEITLFRSEPYPEGSHYTVLQKLALRE